MDDPCHMTAALLAERAANLLRPDGAWCQHVGECVETQDTGQVRVQRCLTRALYHARLHGAPCAACDSAQKEVIDALRHRLALPDSARALIRWNDRPRRRQTEVVAAVDAVARGMR